MHTLPTTTFTMHDLLVDVWYVDQLGRDRYKRIGHAPVNRVDSAWNVCDESTAKSGALRAITWGLGPALADGLPYRSKLIDHPAAVKEIKVRRRWELEADPQVKRNADLRPDLLDAIARRFL